MRYPRKNLPTMENVRMPCQIRMAKDAPYGKRWMSDKETMSMVKPLQNDPEFKRILKGPESMKAVNSGDVATLTSCPRFMNLLNNSILREMQNKVK